MVAEMYRALVEAGVSDSSAQAAASAIPAAEDLATKQDLAEVKTELEQRITEVKTGLGQKITEVKTELEQRISEVKTGLEQRIAEVKQDVAVLKFAVFSFGPVIVGLLVKLVFFPSS